MAYNGACVCEVPLLPLECRQSAHADKRIGVVGAERQRTSGRSLRRLALGLAGSRGKSVTSPVKPFPCTHHCRVQVLIQQLGRHQPGCFFSY
jgi:hypothetical protein